MARKIRSVLLAALMATLMATGLSLTLGTAAVAAPTTATNTFTDLPVTGKCRDAVTGAKGTFTGTLTVTSFTTDGKKLLANGTVDGVCSAGGTLTDVAVTAPVKIAQATCEVLTLELGPIHLELLGLVVDLNKVVLTITADPSGGLLGQLLCSLAGGGTLQQIADLLNQILAILSGL